MCNFIFYIGALVKQYQRGDIYSASPFSHLFLKSIGLSIKNVTVLNCTAYRVSELSWPISLVGRASYLQAVGLGLDSIGHIHGLFSECNIFIFAIFTSTCQRNNVPVMQHSVHLLYILFIVVISYIILIILAQSVWIPFYIYIKIWVSMHILFLFEWLFYMVNACFWLVR